AGNRQPLAVGRSGRGLAGGEGGQELVADVGGGDAGDLGVVVGGRDLHDVGADQVERGEGAERGQQFPAGQAAGLGGAGAGRVRRVEHVDVDRDVHRPLADPGGDPLHETRHAEVLDLGG